MNIANSSSLISQPVKPQRRKRGLSNRTAVAILMAFVLVLSTGFISYFYKVTRNVPRALGVWGSPGHTIDTFSFVDQTGRMITRKDIEGKVTVIEYFFTTCKGICPKMNANLAKVYHAYRGNQDVVFLSHTVDPLNDTVAAMKAFAQRYNADADQWHFLTGSKQRLYDMAIDSYLMSAIDSTASIEEAFIHDQHFMLIDQTGHIRGSNGSTYDGLQQASVDSLITDIRILLDEGARLKTEKRQ